VVSVNHFFGSWQSPLSVTTPAVGGQPDREDPSTRVMGPVHPSPLHPPHHRRPRRQPEQRHLLGQRHVQDGGDEVGCERSQVDHAAHVAVVDAFTPGDLLQGLGLNPLYGTGIPEP
jgi:hypothetical protein